MSCNCGCHDNKTPATGWRRYVPLIVGVAVVGALIAVAAYKNNDKAGVAGALGSSPAGRSSTAARP